MNLKLNEIFEPSQNYKKIKSVKEDCMNRKKIYGAISVLLFIVCIVALTIIDKTNSIELSLTIQVIIILYLIKVAWGCLLYIKRLYKIKKYSYSIIMNLGLLIFLSINIFRQINLLINDWNLTSVKDIYYNTLHSFSYFSYLILPLIVILAIYSIISNIYLIKKEGVKFNNMLGIFFGISVIAGFIASQIGYEVAKNISINDSQRIIKILIDIQLNSILCYFYCLTLATLYCNIMASIHTPGFDKDFIIILGAKIRDDGTLTPILKARVDKALEFAKEQKRKNGKDIIFVPSGGKGIDEIIPEAEAIKNYLIKNGEERENIIIENKSTNTVQNMRFSKNIIDEHNADGKIAFSTTNYHVFRSGVIANNEGMDCEGMGSNTKWYFYPNALIREFVANIHTQCKQHFALIFAINFSLLLLVQIGYKYNLLQLYN